MSALPVPLRQGWTALLSRIDAMSLRERMMVFGALLMLVGLVGDSVLLAPLRARLVAIQRDSARERGELAALDGQAAELKRQLAADPNEVPRLRLQQLTRELETLNGEFARLERSLVAPDQMAPLLEQVLRRTNGVSVVQLQSLAPQALPEREPGDRQGAPEPSLYRHGVELTLRGSYGDLLQYLANVERLPVRVYFGRATLDAAKYPEVDLRVTVYTLGIDKAWLAL